MNGANMMPVLNADMGGILNAENMPDTKKAIIVGNVFSAMVNFAFLCSISSPGSPVMGMS